MSNQLVQHNKILSALNPIDTTGAAANGDFISLKNSHHVTIILQFGVSLVATPAITLSQATDVAGTGAKALAFVTSWVNADTTSGDSFTKTTVASNTFDKSAASEQLIVIEVDGRSLDVENGFDCLRVNLASPGANATLVSMLYIGSKLRHASTDPNEQITD